MHIAYTLKYNITTDAMHLRTVTAACTFENSDKDICSP